MRTFALATAALVSALVLSGCTATPLQSPSLTPPAQSDEMLNSDLQPHPLADASESTAKAEATRLADAMQALIESSMILNIDDQSQLAPADDDIAAYYIAFRNVSLDPSVDCQVLAETISGVLEQSGWTSYDSTNEGGIYIAALTGGTEESSWFVVISGDASVEGQSLVTIQLASPDVTE